MFFLRFPGVPGVNGAGRGFHEGLKVPPFSAFSANALVVYLMVRRPYHLTQSPIMPERFAVFLATDSALSLFGTCRRAAAVVGFIHLFTAEDAFIPVICVVKFPTPCMTGRYAVRIIADSAHSLFGARRRAAAVGGIILLFATARAFFPVICCVSFPCIAPFVPERFAIRIIAVSALSLFGTRRRAAAVGGN